MPWALPLTGIDVLVVVLWGIAAALGIALIMRYIAGALESIPAVGPPLASGVRSIAKAITNACGALIGGIEGLVGAGLHLLARYLDHAFRQFVTHASLILHLARIVGGALYTVTGLRALVHQLSRAVHVVLHRFVRLGRELHGIEHRVKVLEREIAAGIGEDVLPRIKALDRELAKVEHKVIPAIEADVATAESDISALRKWITDNIPLPGTDAFAGAIAVALSLLGLGGLRCNSLLSSLRNRGCGLWQGLEDLLGLFVDAVLFVDLCRLLPELEQLFSLVEAPLVEVIASAADAACAQPPAGWTELDAPQLELPQVYYAGPAIGG